MKTFKRAAFLILILWGVSRFVAVETGQPIDAAGAQVWVLDHGYHAGLAFSRADLKSFASEQSAPLLATYPNADWFEIGWGDRGFYFDVPTLQDVTFAVGAKALLVPSESVMHIATGYGWIDDVFSRSDSISLRLAPESFENLVDAIAGQVDLQAPLRESLYGTGHFYEGAGAYHMFNTCNSWVGQMLRGAGIAVSPGMALTSKTLLRELSWRYGVQ